MALNIHNTAFIKSAASPTGFIDDGRSQIVFAGRSNVGKSSVINILLNRKNFARVGSAPGKTSHVNYFLIDDKVYLVDLPGYGYAKVSKAERDRWGVLMEAFFSTSWRDKPGCIAPPRITLGVMIVDARHKPTADDVTMARWFKSALCPLVVVANKIDKVKKSELAGNIEVIRTTLDLSDNMHVIPFSAQTGEGRERLLSEVLSVGQ